MMHSSSNCGCLHASSAIFSLLHSHKRNIAVPIKHAARFVNRPFQTGGYCIARPREFSGCAATVNF